jgi:hypothetical protein
LLLGVVEINLGGNMNRLVAGVVAISACLDIGGMSVHACDARDHYDFPVNVGFLVGVMFLPTVAFTYGIDIRGGHGPALGFGRLEGHGLTNLKLSVGIQAITKYASSELGAAFVGPHHGTDVASALGLHLGVGLWDPNLALSGIGTVPIAGDRRNYDVAADGFVVLPGNICPPG